MKMNLRVWAVLIIGLALFCLFMLPAHAETTVSSSGTCGEDVTWTLDNTGILTITGNGPMKDYSYGESPWSDNASVKTVVIGDGVIHIGSFAFSFCENLTEVSVGNGVQTIGANAFLACKSLSSVAIGSAMTVIDVELFNSLYSLQRFIVDDNNTYYSSDSTGVLFNKDKNQLIFCPRGYGGSYRIPDYVTVIATGAFSNCGGLTEVVFGNGVTGISGGLFSNCESLQRVTIGDSVKSIASTAFEYCSSLTQISVSQNNPAYSSDSFGVLFNKDKTKLIRCPLAYNGHYPITEGVTAIGYGAFEDCNGLTGVTIPNTVRTVGFRAFAWCSGLTDITLPDSIAQIDRCAFRGCGLRSISIPQSITDISDCVFGECTELVDVTIPRSVTHIGTYAFFGCSSLVSVTVPDSVVDIGEYAFSQCTALTSVNIPEGVTKIARETFCGTALTDITIPQSVTQIDEYAFRYCDALTSVFIPRGVQHIASTAFSECSSMKEILVDANSTAYSSDSSGILYNKDKTELICCPQAYSGACEIPGGVTSISDYAFYGIQGLTAVVIPQGVQRIGRDAFAGCANLASIHIADSVTHIESEEGVFYYTAYYNNESNWTDGVLYIDNCLIDIKSTVTGIFTVPGNVTCIADGALTSGDLDAIYVEEDNPTYSSDGFGVLYNKDKTQLIRCPQTVQGVYEIPEGVTVIRDFAFMGCDELIGVRFPQTLRAIGKRAFLYCSGITELQIPDEVTDIGENAFWGCQGLQSISLPAKLTSIEPHLLHYCTSLTSITIPEGVTRIGAWSFGLCGDLEEVILPSTLTHIDAVAFTECFQLSSITIPASVQQIGGGAFSMAGLTEIVFEGSAPSAHYQCEGWGPGIFNGSAVTAYYPAYDSSWTEDIMQVYGGDITWVPVVAVGDFDADGKITDSDAMYLLRYTLFPERYPVGQDADVNADGTVNDTDAMYLLRYTLFPDRYPLYPSGNQNG